MKTILMSGNSTNKKFTKKEVIKMKRMIMIIMASAMVVVFAPKVDAGEVAQLGLQVTFAPSEPLKIWSEPQGPFKIEAGKTITFDIIAEDMDSRKVELVAINIPPDATFEIVERTDYDPGTGSIGSRVRYQFEWTPKIDSTANEVGYKAVFEARNAEGETARVDTEISVINNVISIELEGPNPWVLEGVKLGEKRTNANPYDAPMHKIHNTGNVPVSVGIGYAKNISIPENPQPGLEQGFNRYITLVRDTVIPPTGTIPVVKRLAPMAGEPVPLTYGAPTGVMNRARGMSAEYALRVFKAIEPLPYPTDPILQK